MMLRYFFLALTLVVLAVVAIAGFRGHKFTRPPFEIFPDMNYQDKVKDQVPSAFFTDGNSARPPIPGTIAEEMPRANDYWSTGKWDDTHWGTGIPVHEARDGGRALVADDLNMARGRERYGISCAPCHGAAGDGQGITSKYGLNGAASYHTDRLRQTADGDLFNTITNGKGQMLGYGYNITIDDRWRIVMYLRALQLSQNARYADASDVEKSELDQTKRPEPPPAPAPTQPAAPAAGGNPQAANQAPAAPTPPTPPKPGQPSGPVSPATGGSPSPTVSPDGQEKGTNNAAGKPPSSASISVPSRLIHDDGMVIVGPTYFDPFASAKKVSTKRIDGAQGSYTPPRSRPVLLLSQATMKGWIDSYDF